MDPLNPGARPRRGVLAVASLAAASALVGVIVVALPTSTAEASGLARFSTCGEVAAWGAASQDRRSELPSVGGDVMLESSAEDAGGDGAAAPTSAAGGEADRQASGSGGAQGVAADDGTNVVVEGVDELDLVDRLDEDRALVVADDRLAIVDLVRARLVATLDGAAGAQVTYDPEAGVAWVVGTGGSAGVLREGPTDTIAPTGEVTVTRVAVGDDTLAAEAEWTTSGTLVDARRVGDRLHLVATEGFARPGEGDVAVPFEDGPVPCDEVLHPVGPSDPSATLLVTLPVTGALEPTAAAEVVGAGQLVHVTTDAAYLATPLWEGGRSVTGLHRFDLDTLAHTGSGRVDGSLLDEFSMSDHEGVLRVAVTHDGAVGMPMPVDGIGDGEVFTEEPAPAPPPPGMVAPDQPVEPDVVEPDEPEGQILNEVVALDTDGDLDVIGRTERFGHPGERIQGVRFVGDVAYAVTFLQTDPFYVLDLSSPTAPVVTGEVELPGFSAYLHPISDTLVAGFGPAADGAAAVKLFDVSDPAAPKVVDDLALGDESAVVWDHHAFVDLGDGRFAVPATTYTEEFPESCPPEAQQEAKATEARIQGELQDVYAQQETGAPAESVDDRAAALYEELDALTAEGCLYPGTVPDSAVVVVDTADGRLREVERLDVRVAGGATRVLPSAAGWSVLGTGELVLLDQGGIERARLDLR